MSVLRQMFEVDKPIIAMVHLPPLPGRPLHARTESLDAIVDRVAEDLAALQSAEVDGLLFCNEMDYPYQLSVGPEVAAAMAYVIGRLRNQITRPFGVNLLWDAKTTLAVARGTGASFVREVFLGVYASDFGVISADIGTLAAYRDQIGGSGIRIFTNITPEFSRPMDDRSISARVRSAEFLGMDAVLISGQMAGETFDMGDLREAKDAAKKLPIMANTGVRQANIGEVLQVADGAIVGTSLKQDGYIWNAVDPVRAAEFMASVRECRARLSRVEGAVSS
jgi:membrane complex biogenesis BtpA family protein